MAITHNVVQINLQAGGLRKRIPLSSADVGDILQIQLLYGSAVYTPAVTDTITMQGTKLSGLGYSVTGTLTASTIQFTVTADMTSEEGIIPSEIVLTDANDNRHGSANFEIYIEENPHPDDTVDGTAESVRNTILQYVDDEIEAYLDDYTIDASTDLDGLSDVTISSPSDGQILQYDADNSVWVNVTSSGGGGTVTPDNISMSGVTGEESLTLTFTDGYYVQKYWTTGSNSNMSIMEAEIPEGATSITYTTYDAPTNYVNKAQFLLDSGATSIVVPTVYEQVESLLYACTCDVPDGAVSFRSTVYTSKKDSSYVNATKLIYYTPSWLRLADDIVDADAVDADADVTKTACDVTYEDGYYTMYYNSSGGFYSDISDSTKSTIVATGLSPLTLYEVDSYYDPSASAGGYVVWYDANGNRLTDDGIPYNYLISSNQVSKNSHQYRQIVMSPLKAASAKITISLAAKDDCVFNLIAPTTKTLEWLSVGIRNLSSQCRELLVQDSLDAVKDMEYPYHSEVDKSVSIASKSVVLFGDSIAAGVVSGTTDSSFKSWANIVKTRLSLTLTNQAVSGANITDDTGLSSSISAKVLAYTGDAAVAIIAGGTNDHSNGKSLGAWGDTTVETFYGALYAMCEYLTTLSLEKVIFITPTNKTNTYANENTLDDYREAIQITARYYGFDVIEGKDFGFPESKGTAQELFVYDGIHPTQQGHVMYANNVCSWL